MTQHQKIRATDTVLIPITDSRYPPPLKEIFDPPPLLFVRGRWELLGTLMLAVVGTRHPSAYGTAAAARFPDDAVQGGGDAP